jgi:hypothetical protein
MVYLLTLETPSLGAVFNDALMMQIIRSADLLSLDDIFFIVSTFAFFSAKKLVHWKQFVEKVLGIVHEKVQEIVQDQSLLVKLNTVNFQPLQLKQTRLRCPKIFSEGRL